MITRKTNRLLTRLGQAFAIFLPVLLVLAVNIAPYAQNSVGNKSASAAGKEIPTNELKEFKSLIEKNRTALVSGTASIEVKEKLYAIFEKMPENQQQESEFIFIKTLIPVKKHPDDKLFSAWKDPKKFGVWLDGKKVNNSVLNQMKPEDISEFSLSNLYGAAKRSYKYQLDLTSTREFDRTYDKRVRDRVVVSQLIPPPPPPPIEDRIVAKNTAKPKSRSTQNLPPPPPPPVEAPSVKGIPAPPPPPVEARPKRTNKSKARYTDDVPPPPPPAEARTKKSSGSTKNQTAPPPPPVEAAPARKQNEAPKTSVKAWKPQSSGASFIPSFFPIPGSKADEC